MRRALTPFLGLLLVLPACSASSEVYLRREGRSFVLGTSRVERALTWQDGALLLTGLRDKSTDRELLGPGRGIGDFSLLVGPERAPLTLATPGWTLVEARQSRLPQGELQVELTLQHGALRITRGYVLYPGSSIIREVTTITNASASPVLIADPTMLCIAACAGAPNQVDFHWMTGAHNVPGLWNLKTEALRPNEPRRFDSYDPPPHERREPPGPKSHRPGTASYAPWYAVRARDSGQGLFIGFDYFGRWASSFEARADETVVARLSLAGFSRRLEPGQSITTPAAFVGLFSDDLDNAGNELLDWQYAYLWDYTRDGRDGGYPWFPALRALGNWHKGTGWGKAGVSWTGGDPDMPSLFRKVFRVADYMRSTGTDVYHRDWGWWDIAGDWNGPDFGATGDYLRRYSMGQLIYAFLYTVDARSRVAREHPDWLLGAEGGGHTLDLSRPEVVQFIQSQLDEFVKRWGAFEWRNDSTFTAPRPDDGSVLLEQDQAFRRILRTFLDRYPDCAFQAVNGGGNYAGYDYLRYASNVQFSDGAIGPLRNYWAALLFPPDKSCDNPDQWNPDKYDKATWRGLLCFNYDTTGDTIDPDKLEGIRQLNDIYHYLRAQGVVGRWVRVHRPVVVGDDPTMWFQRLSRDRKRSIIIPKHVPPGPVTVRPKGLLPGETYVLSFQESDAVERRIGADLMARGIELRSMAPGELIYLNLPLHPGSSLDTTPPAPPQPLAVAKARRMGYPGVELSWKGGTDDNWISYHEVYRDGRLLDKVARGAYYFDHSAGADVRAGYELRAVDGAGNRSAAAGFPRLSGRRASVLDDADLTFAGAWQRLAQPPAHDGTLRVALEKGAGVRVAVDGKRVVVFCKLGADCGKLGVGIDDAPPQIVDTYSADDIWGVGVLEHEFATPGRHTLHLTVLGEHHRLSSGNKVHLDGIRIEQD